MAKKTTQVPEPVQARSINYGPLPDLIGFHLRFAATALYREYTAAVGETGLTQHQHGIVQLAALNPGLTQAEIADALGTDRVSLIAIIDKLEARDLIRRERSVSDRRRQELQVTPEGRALLARGNALIKKHEAQIAGRLLPDQLNSLLDALRRIHGRDF
jgi:DNA-binding MarR family transcriptional regulator